MDCEQATVIGDETKKKKLPNLAHDVEPGFVAPDGGWGWMIIIAAGFSNFCSLTLLLVYGLLFREYFERVGINITQATTISNINSAVISCVGLTNGTLFRKFSYRQVSCFGSFLSALSVCVLSFTKTFYGILIFFGIFHAIGSSLALSSCALALNTYFKKKRRMAISLAWTCTGLAPMVIPQLVALWLPIYDVSGTVLLLGGLMFNAFACALLLQPVSKHVKEESVCQEKKTYTRMDAIKENDTEMNCILPKRSSKALSMGKALLNNKPTNIVKERLGQGFGSKYLSYDDKQQGVMGVDVIMTETPMISPTNDKCFTGEKNGLERRNSSQLNGARTVTADDHYKNTDNDQMQKIDDHTLLNNGDNITESLFGVNTLTCSEKYDQHKETKDSWHKRTWHAFAVFFDLDLLQDPVYVNLMIGITLLNFSDINLFQLTPFILGDYGLEQIDVANIMSVMAIVDIITRLAIPIIASRIGWENRVFYIVSMVILVASRTLLAHLKSYNLLMAVAVLTGVGKAFRQVFVAIVIPDHVPLERLAAATGLQEAFAGITYLTFGPVVGWIRDVCADYTLTLHFLNLFPYVVIISWILELSYFSMKRKRLNRTEGRTISA